MIEYRDRVWEEKPVHSLKALIGGALEEPILHEVKEVVQGYVHAHHTVHLPAEQQTQVTTLCTFLFQWTEASEHHVLLSVESQHK